MQTLINPMLRTESRVRLRSGCIGTIADNASHRRSRLIDIGTVNLDKIDESEIVGCFIDQQEYRIEWDHNRPMQYHPLIKEEAV